MSVMTATRTGLPADRPLTIEDLDLSGNEAFAAVRPFASEIVPSALVAIPGRH
jgi:hypothetical protein